MKKLFWILVIATVAFFGIQHKNAIAQDIQNIVYQTPCATPRTYSIGAIDPRFNISQDEFLANTQQAGSLWKNEDGKPLFVYDPNSKLTISLIYDERQLLNNQVNNLNDQVVNQKNTLKPEIADYEKRSANFKRRNANLNAKVDYWNNQGGAPADEYNKLLQEQKNLQEEAQQLQAMAQTLNQSTDEYNTQIQQLDQKVDAYNQTLSVKPEEGEYIRNKGQEKIVIYFNNSHPELVHTLAHEMGHAIGLQHNTNRLSIMYPKTTLTTTLSSTDISALAEACRKRSIAETFQEKLSLIVGTVSGVAQKYLHQ